MGAAAKAFKLGLLDEGGVQAVIDKAASELEASTKSTSDQVRKPCCGLEHVWRMRWGEMVGCVVG